jgi:hypothetical protein
MPNRTQGTSRQSILSGGLALLGLLLMQPRMAAAQGQRPMDKEAIEDLMLCYGRGTDAIGNSTTNADPLSAGEAIYAGCFTKDAVFRVWFPGTPFTSPAFPDPTIDPPDDTLIGSNNWAVFVNGVFRSSGYTFTQHILTNMVANAHGNNGTLVAYLNASHVIQSSGVVTCLRVANGTYSLGVVKTSHGWRVKSLDLTLIDFVPFFGCN